MTDYIKEIKRQFRDVYGLTPTGGTDEEPLFEKIPDGVYPMTIGGKVDNVAIKDNFMGCCNFDEPKEIKANLDEEFKGFM